jgi:hypothetical protein
VEAQRRRHRIAVIRAEVADHLVGRLLIELLEVNFDHAADRVLGRTTDPARACRLLEGWLRGLRASADPPPPATGLGPGAETVP